MHHLVQQRVESFVPAMPAQMPPADCDLTSLAILRSGIVSEPALHPSRDPHGDCAERSAKVLVVESRMPRRQSLGEWLIVRLRSFAPQWATTCRRVDDVCHDSSLRGSTLGTCPSFHERDDRLVHLQWRAEVAFMNTQLAPAEADHDVAILRQLAMLDSFQTERSQMGEQLVGAARRRGRFELERQLTGIVPAAEERPQRAKHFTGPATKSRCSVDHSSVETSMSASVILMLFTDDGRPPRDRLLMVPEVEMIVPRFVCSM